jgi:hypothetical protein
MKSGAGAITKPMVLLTTMLVLLSTLTREASFAYAQEAPRADGIGAASNNNPNPSGIESNTADSNLSPQELFYKLDVNHDSSLTLKDFYKLDANQDAEISMGEFTTALGSSSSSSSSQSNEDDTGGFVKGFTSSTAMIIATEIGDKTFFIAAVLSMRHSRLIVFSGAILALICMTILRLVLVEIEPVRVHFIHQETQPLNSIISHQQYNDGAHPTISTPKTIHAHYWRNTVPILWC